MAWAAEVSKCLVAGLREARGRKAARERIDEDGMPGRRGVSVRLGDRLRGEMCAVFLREAGGVRIKGWPG